MDTGSFCRCYDTVKKYVPLYSWVRADLTVKQPASMVCHATLRSNANCVHLDLRLSYRCELPLALNCILTCCGQTKRLLGDYILLLQAEVNASWTDQYLLYHRIALRTLLSANIAHSDLIKSAAVQDDWKSLRHKFLQVNIDLFLTALATRSTDWCRYWKHKNISACYLYILREAKEALKHKAPTNLLQPARSSKSQSSLK